MVLTALRKIEGRGAHETAHRIHGRLAREVEVELAFDGGAELVAEQFAHEFLELAVNVEFGGGMRARARNLRIIGDDGGELVGLDEVGDHEILKRLALQRRLLQRFEVAISQTRLLEGSEARADFGAEVVAL